LDAAEETHGSMPPVINLGTGLWSRGRLVYALAALAGLVLFGTAGFCAIEGWSVADGLYMTVMTITTVGYGPPLPLTPAGRDFAIVFMVVGVGTTGYLISVALQTLLRSELVTAYGERRRHREMGKLRDHYIICGVGRVGSRIVAEMRRAGVPFVAVESDPQKAALLGLQPAELLVRDATLDETLREAGVERASGLAACLPDDADNLYVVLSARSLNHGLHIVARAVEEQAEPKLIKAGASRVVAPTIIGSHRMAQALLKPAVADFMDSLTADSLGLGFEQIEVAGTSVFVGRMLKDTPIRTALDVVVAAIRRDGGEMTFNPSGETRIEAGDLLIAIGRAESLREMTAAARGVESSRFKV
jgi:voltage-gated potassium channel